MPEASLDVDGPQVIVRKTPPRVPRSYPERFGLCVSFLEHLMRAIEDDQVTAARAPKTLREFLLIVDRAAELGLEWDAGRSRFEDL